jgi:hypothetical protein
MTSKDMPRIAPGAQDRRSAWHPSGVELDGRGGKCAGKVADGVIGWPASHAAGIGRLIAADMLPHSELAEVCQDT